MKNKRSELIKETFLKELTIVTGAPASGKSLLAPIVGSLDRCENFRMSTILEHIGSLNQLEKIPSESLVFLYKYIVDFMLYDNMIGRDLNFRFGDETSLFNTENPEKYFNRMLSERGEFIVDEIEKNKPLLVLALSDALSNISGWFEAYPFLKMIHIRRHPVDIIYSWYNHRYGEDVKPFETNNDTNLTYGSETYNSKINQVLLIRSQNGIVPYYASGWANDYLSMCEMDRVIFMIDTINKNYIQAIKNLKIKENKNILFLTFDDTVVNTSNTVNKVCEFLNTKTTTYTTQVLERENCPRILKESDRHKKFKVIKELASDKALNHLKTMENDYNILGSL